CAESRLAAGQRRVLDEATRQRRLARQLEALEKDNFQDDPLSSLPQVLLPAYLPSVNHFKQSFRKNFTTLLEEVVSHTPPFSLTAHHFCCVCGFPSHYTCTTCGGRYCSTKCLCTHRETRCLKWTL
uniref:Zinc finger, HIT-type containing 1 n=2 Tax=Oreochromis TaxID=8139 RepID=I3JNP8_ORENI